MKRIIWIIGLIIGCLIAGDVFSCEVKVRVIDLPPHYIKDGSGKWHGLAVELAEALLKEARCKPIYQILPWGRALVEMKNGENDMMMNLNMTNERKEFMYFVGPQPVSYTHLTLPTTPYV